MSAAFELALIVTMCVLLMAVSAAAGALWWRLRSLPVASSSGLERELAERLRALEIEHEHATIHEPHARQGTCAGPPTQRADGALARAMTGPTLITVPDLTAPAMTYEPSPAAVELGRRFGAIWELAEAGATSEMIAQETGLPVGHVELILGLRRQLEAAAAWPTSGNHTT